MCTVYIKYLIYRGYLTFSVYDRILFHDRTTKAVFSRVAKPRVKIPLLVFMCEIKNDLSLKKSNFLFLFCLKNCNNLVYSNAPAFRTETQLFLQPVCVKFDAFSVFTGYVLGCKHSLQLKNISKLRLNKQISRN